MPALIDLRRQIKSVQNTQQITQAMKTVATAKFKKAQRSILAGRPAWHHYPELIAKIGSWTENSFHPLLDKRKEKKALLLVISADKGLCGSFNTNLLNTVHDFLEEKTIKTEFKLFLAGKKAILSLAKHSCPVEWTSEKEIKKYEDQDYQDIATRLCNQYAWKHTDAVYIAYNEFKSILAPKISISKLLPIEYDENSSPQETGTENYSNVDKSVLSPDWAPDTDNMMDYLLPFYIKDQIRHFFQESNSAENAARMMAMDNASINAGELIKNLKLVMNKIRQSLITKELLEIITAVEALSKK